MGAVAIVAAASGVGGTLLLQAVTNGDVRGSPEYRAEVRRLAAETYSGYGEKFIDCMVQQLIEHRNEYEKLPPSEDPLLTKQLEGGCIARSS